MKFSQITDLDWPAKWAKLKRCLGGVSRHLNRDRRLTAAANAVVTGEATGAATSAATSAATGAATEA
jgi:hypothetical protein